jgi:hypothetical protein
MIKLILPLLVTLTTALAQEGEVVVIPSDTLVTLTTALAQEGEVAVIPSDTTKDPGLKIGDIAPSWALMSGPGKFEFLKTWTEEKGKRTAQTNHPAGPARGGVKFFCYLV